MNVGGINKTKSFRILVVDDDPNGLDFFDPPIQEAWGRLHSIETVQVSTADEALNRLSLESFAVVLVAWKTNAFNGGVFLRNLRGYGMRTPVVIVSSLQRGDIRDNIESFGAVFLNRGLVGGTALRDSVGASMRLISSSQASSDGVSRRFPFKSKPPKSVPPM
jgi:CheY-like chemotaxis protein